MMTDNAMMNESNKQAADNKNNITLWVMVLLFGLPYVAATYFYFNRDEIDLGSTSNYGTIITPARPIPDVELTRLDNSNFKLSSLRGTWVLLSIGSSECEKDCLENLYKIRQLRKAVGQDYKRISKVYFLQDTNYINRFEKLLTEYPDMDVFVPSNEKYQKYLSIFSYKGSEIKDGIYIIDPLGNYMMMYPKGSDPSKMVKDIERLLKISKIG